ncbi:MFS transporter [Cupriavidus sp. IK-TO18]|uniref:MFS transporter n=1 Tax=Cupriavidus sp. IK-TO18 TaxID=2782182 RepID=UPI0018984EE9|nr:MFS transporter [Cupriavidus sp. IK-TO18]MBF6988384.1 MFS transporter [Cupriavidus sp. IK-TO18]
MQQTPVPAAPDGSAPALATSVPAALAPATTPASAPAHPRMQLTSHPEMGHWRLSLFGLTLGLVTGIDFSSTLMMGVASQHIQGAVGAAPEDYLYAVSAYAATAVLMNMVLDQVARRITYKRFTLVSLVVFILGSLICAEFATPTGLISGKAVQGLGAGGLFAASRILVQLVSTPAERGALMLRFGGGAFSMLALAPWLTSMFLDDIGWRAVFLFQAGIALPVLLSVALTYPTRAPRDRHPPVSTLDWPAAIAAAAGALVILHTLQEMRYTRFFSSLEMPLAALCGLALFAFAGWRLYRHPDPWIDLSRLAGRQYLYGLGFYTLYYLMSSAWAFLLPSLTQTGLGLTFRTTCMLLATSGAVATIGAVAITLGMALVFRKRRVIALGFVFYACAAMLFSHQLMPGAPDYALVPVVLLEGLTPVLLMVQVASMTYLEVPVEDFSHAYQFKNVCKQIASAVGTGLASVFMQDGLAEHRTHLVEQVTRFNPALQSPDALSASGLAKISLEIDRQATLLAGMDMLHGFAVICVLGAVFVLVQRSFR